jgi:segregation and condensation protein A
VSRKTGELLRHLILRGFEKLKNLFKGNKSRTEVVATFISILEMCKNNTVSLEDDPSGENPTIRLIKNPVKEESENGTN